MGDIHDMRQALVERNTHRLATLLLSEFSLHPRGMELTLMSPWEHNNLEQAKELVTESVRAERLARVTNPRRVLEPVIAEVAWHLERYG